MRTIEATRAVFGTALLVAPRPMLRHVHRVEVDRPSVVVARVLGARQLAQALLSARDPGPDVLALGIYVDLTHAGTALGLAAADRSRAVAGLLNAALSVGWAGFGYEALVSRSATDASPGGRDRIARWILDRAPGGSWLRRRAPQRRVRSAT